ncbi:MAG: hypothetical protein MZV49_24095 [Rhodopseudomonas palustris]|nr:hypothetical protein [Rhodopseudomonas palustris]
MAVDPRSKSWVEQTQPPFKVRQNARGEFRVYRFPNEEIYTQVNTVLKMAKKRAQVDAALSVGRLSNIFTQDIEDTGTDDYTSFFTTSPRQKREAKPKPEPAAPKVMTPDQMAKETEKLEKKTKPAPEKETYPLITLTLSNGTKVNVTQYQALDYFSALKESLTKLTGDEAMYYATLEQFGYTHSKDVPIEKITGVWDTLIGIWKMHQGKNKKKE